MDCHLIVVSSTTSGEGFAVILEYNLMMSSHFFNQPRTYSPPSPNIWVNSSAKLEMKTLLHALNLCFPGFFLSLSIEFIVTDYFLLPIPPIPGYLVG